MYTHSKTKQVGITHQIMNFFQFTKLLPGGVSPCDVTAKGVECGLKVSSNSSRVIMFTLGQIY